MNLFINNIPSMQSLPFCFISIVLTFKLFMNLSSILLHTKLTKKAAKECYCELN